MIGIYIIFQFEDYVFEKTLGTLFKLLPKRKNIDETFLEINKQRLAFPYDINDDLLDIFGYHPNNKIFSRKGQSIYKEINGFERN